MVSESCGLTLPKSVGDDHETGFCAWSHTNGESQQKYREPDPKCTANASRPVFVKAATCPTTEDLSVSWVRKARVLTKKVVLDARNPYRRFSATVPPRHQHEMRQMQVDSWRSPLSLVYSAELIELEEP